MNSTHDESSIDWMGRLDEAVGRIRATFTETPRVGIVLGSGLGAFAERLEDARSIPYSEIPGFARSSVVGHAGRLVAGRVAGVPVVVMQGRVHGYEGYSPAEVVFPIRALCRLGIEALVVTNAAGCIEPEWAAGDLMLITDHLNLSGKNPLVGHNDDRLGPRFPDMSAAYAPTFVQAAREAAAKTGVALREGVYTCMSGPSYETPAEVRMLRLLGGHAVGMSTVPEVIAAAHMGVPVCGLSCLTNMAAGILDQPLSHDEVTETAARVRDQFIDLLAELVPRLTVAR